MLSVWSDNSNFQKREPLKGEKRTQVLVIGGGAAGILCAEELKSRGADCILAEADRLCKGVTQNTTAKITAQHGFIYDSLIKKKGCEQAKMYFEANENAVKKYRELCRGIDCDFEDGDNAVYTLTDARKAEKELDALLRLGADAEFNSSLPIPVKIQGAVRLKNQAQFNPLKFFSEISKNIECYEHTKIFEIRENTAFFAGGSIHAEHIVIATHFPFINKYGGYFAKLYQERSYAVYFENGPKLDGMYIDEAAGGLSFRNYKDGIIVGGGAHRTGKPGEGWTAVKNFAAEKLPGCREKYRWAAQDCMSLDKIPYIGKYSKRTGNLYAVTGFNKWGMTSSMAAAGIISDMIFSKNNDYAEAFSPSRSIFTLQLAVNAAETAAGLMSLSKKRCPHLGCALKWNNAEHSWDCPCHGSRFTETGKLIENPATDDLKN